MEHPLHNPVHTFFIPVMGTGFTIDTPLKVARYGISSVVSLVDDVLIEQMREKVAQTAGRAYAAIGDREDDARARRITAYLNLVNELVQEQLERLRTSAFTAGSEITRYYEMLPPSPLRSLYDKMLAAGDPEVRGKLQQTLRERIRPGGIDVNIMTKLDRLRAMRGEEPLAESSDAMTALRGYAQSKLTSSVVLSAGLNRKLFNYLREFADFLPDAKGIMAKRIVLKVSDFRSARIQGTLLARLGLWVSEFRVESGLNCGGHAFGGAGTLMGPILEDFHRERDELTHKLYACWCEGLKHTGHTAPDTPPEVRVTVQGGIGTAEENALLRDRYHVDGMGWASPFLLVPDVVNIDAEHLAKIRAAGEDDGHLSDASPLGVPFWCLKESASETTRRERIADGKPGSACPKGFLVANTEFTDVPICTASRAYQRRKLQDLDGQTLTDLERLDATEHVTAKACICHDLAGAATSSLGIDPNAHTAVCCGPNTVYFSKVAQLREMVDHIYGRIRLPLAENRPHMFLNELSLHVERLRTELDRRRDGLPTTGMPNPGKVRDELMTGIQHYRKLAATAFNNGKASFQQRLESLGNDLEKLRP
ncbi:hypothetical protein DRQ50_13620 [bacterium]|nr:MAG: hypothetical protein DRQ50_13620 [bacterium]